MTENTPPTESETRRHISDGYQSQGDDRALRRLRSQAAAWNPETAARRAAVERAEDKGFTLSPISLLSAGYADVAKAAHDRLNEEA